MIELFSDYFWNTATQCIELIVPVLALFLIFRLVHDILWRE